MMENTVQGLRLSPQQKRVWLLQQNSRRYCAQCTACVEGILDPTVLLEAFHEVIVRHEILRTTFRDGPGVKIPFQVIQETSAPLWTQIDLRGVDLREQETTVERLYHEERNTLFDFEQGPLLRASLLHLSRQRQVLLISLPALCADAWTLHNLLWEIAQRYRACLEGERLVDEPVQYAQFSEWQNELLAGEHGRKGKRYWQKHLLVSIPVVTFPFERAVPNDAERSPESVESEISPEQVSKLEGIARCQRTSLETIILAGWQILIWRLTGLSDVVVAALFHGRKYEELHDAMGLFAKYLPLHLSCEGSLPFTEVLSQVHEAQREGFKWQEYFRWPDQVRTSSNTPDDPVAFEFQQCPLVFRAGDVTFHLDRQYIDFDRYKLKLSCLQKENTLRLTFHYDPGRFFKKAIACLADQFTALLQSVVNNPETQVRDLGMLSQTTRQQLLGTANGLDSHFPNEECLHQLFEAQVSRHASAIAVVYGDRQLTYAELNVRANQLAHWLFRQGIRRGTLVGLCVERSLEMLVGLLGVLKTGAAYVPLDPTMAKARWAYQAAHARIAVLVTQETLLGQLPAFEGKTLCLDRDAQFLQQEPDTDPVGTISSQDLAYVIYTSGSTGTPKGVAVPHSSVTNYTLWLCQHLQAPSGWHFATVSTLSADLGNTAIFASLVSGGCLHIVGYDVATDSQQFASYCTHYPIDVLKIVPSHLRVLLDLSEGNAILPRKWLILGGETFTLDLLDRITRLGGSFEVMNHYGPTETTIGSVTFRLVEEEARNTLGCSSVPIGRPIANMEAYILDEQLQLLPVGIPGELYIGGLGVAQGYLNQPELTAERFLPHPFSATGGQRVYRTGDLARYLPEGNIEFLGRRDHQLKIRGYRVELGEIEARLVEHTGIREAVVVAREERSGSGLQLVAYLVPKGVPPEMNGIREFLKERLPEYMLPSTFVFLDALPLTPNGKIDRQALPVPEVSHEMKRSYVPPRTPTEEILASMWGEVLGKEQVGIHDNFFDLGGHSLLATQLMSRLQSAFQVELPLRTLFQFPSISALARAVDETRLKEPRSQAPPLVPTARDRNISLSFAQQRLWFLAQLEPENPFYNIPAAVRLIGVLDTSALQQSFNEVVRRHEILRTTVSAVDGRSTQVIACFEEISLPVVDLSILDENEREAAVYRLAPEEARSPFDLIHGPLLRIKLLRVNKDEHILLVTLHHIVSDGWSRDMLIREVVTLYEAFAAGRPSPLPPLPIQYADFAVWQRQWLQGEVLEAQLAYWRRQLSGAPVLELPTDRPRPAVQTYRGASYRFTVPQVLAEQLTMLSRQQGVTLFMTLLAAFQVLLFRYTGETDLCIGIPIANRNRSELEGLIGFFVNTLVLRTDLSGNPQFVELLARVREVALGAQAHQDLPFDYLVDALQPTRVLSQTPLFQVMFALQTLFPQRREIPGLQINMLYVDPGSVKFDLSLDMIEGEEGLEGVFEYSTDLFDKLTIQRMATHLQRVLEGLVAQPETCLDELPLLAADERQSLLVDWNSARTDIPRKQCVHELFEAQVERTPQATAVIFEEQSLTYGELNARANRLAHYLRQYGVRPEVRVAICLERSLEMVVGLLGILKSGGAYLPIDPTYPPERVAFMLEDARVRVLLTHSNVTDRVPASHVAVIHIDRMWPSIMQECDSCLISGVRSDNLAYVIYTSGSTGKPKGVMVAHRSLVNYVMVATEQFKLKPADRVLQFASISFDASGEEIYPCLVSGSTLIVRTERMLESVPTFLKTCRAWAVSVLDLPTMYWHGLTTALGDEDQTIPPSVRLVVIGGEQALPERLTAWKGLIRSDVRLLNTYGPTEATIVATVRDLSEPGELCQRVSIGRPIPNAQIYVLDGSLQPVPIGIPGEFYIGGVGLARGYLNRPDLTAEKFIPDEFCSEPGSRLYRTGDRGRWLPDGNLEVLGRFDHQIKLRGFRIELGEIEAVLRQHPAVRDAVALVREDHPGEKRLVAYVTPNGGLAPNAEELRRWLQGRLPDYMVPALIVALEVLPLLSNGKVDSHALPAPETSRHMEQQYVKPRTPTEEILAGIWTDVLGVGRVGIRDNFFEHGGDSILSLQVVARARQAGLVLTPRQLFQHQTIAELAVAADRPARCKLKLEQGPVSGEVPLTPIQHWFFEQDFSNPQHWNQAVLLEAKQPLDERALETAVEHLLRHHDALRTRFLRNEAGWQQRIELPVPAALIQRVNLSNVAEGERDKVLERTATDWQGRLHLTEGPLLRVVLFDLGGHDAQRLLIAIHHLVVDGVSWRVLLEDLQLAYQQALSGETVRLPAKTTSFQDWAERLQVYAQSDTVQQEVAYWLDARWANVRPLPIDNAAGDCAEATSETVTVALSEADTQALLQEVPRAYRTQINDVLLTSLVQTLDSPCVLVDLEGHGREDLFPDFDVSRTVGWFTTVFPVLLEVEADAPPGEALKAVKEQLRRIPNRGIGYGLIQYLKISHRETEQLRTHPVAQLGFNYLGQFDQAFATTSLFAPVKESNGRAHDPRNQRRYEWNLSAAIVGGRLKVDWTYSRERYWRTTMEAVSHEYLRTLQGLIAHCVSAESGGYTPSDFPLCKLDQTTIDRLLGNNREIEDVYPLTPLQQGMLFHTLYAPNSGMYLEQVTCTLEGNLDAQVFRQAWQHLVDKYPILRTSFLWQGVREPLQIVHRQVTLQIGQHDWRGQPRDEQELRLAEFLEKDRNNDFELSHSPLIRLSLIRISQDTHYFVWSHHHLLLDGWCLPIIFKDLLECYESLCCGQRPILVSSRPYREYIAWLQRQDSSAAERYWRSELAGLSAPTSLGVDLRPGSGSTDSHGASKHEIGLSASVTREVLKFVQRHQLTLNTVVQGAWALLLSRYSGERDVLFGATVSGRSANLPGIEAMVGLFINTLPIRVKVRPDATVLGWLKELLARNTELREYEFTPLVQIQGWSEVPRDQPLFESLLVFENYPLDHALHGWRSSLMVRDVCSKERTNYPLNLKIVPGQELGLHFIYNSGRFTEDTIHRMAGHLMNLLQECTVNPQARVSDLSPFQEDERYQLVEGWNATYQPYPKGRYIHELVEDQVKRRPKAVAVVCKNQFLTYEELNAQANQVAHYLRSHGVNQEVRVGICLERSVELVVGVLGILKAGGAYVPVDPDYPQERLAFVLEDAEVQVLITQERFVEKLPEHGKTVCLDTDWKVISQESTDNVWSGVTASNLAYVIYTSGSTGEPKGVQIEHRGLLNLVFWHLRAFGVSHADRATLVAGPAFDASVWELWPYLAAGASVHIVDDETRSSPLRLQEWLFAQSITISFLPTPLTHEVLSLAWHRDVALRTLLTGGEKLHCYPRTAIPFEVVNNYGPTETTVVATSCRIPQKNQADRAPSMGRPVDNTKIYLLDPHLQPVPVGVPGELCISGTGMARGYWRRPELTAERFIPDPFSTEPGCRLYKTGDVARYEADGMIEFLGRRDHQVKIRGCRVELEEVETQLRLHPMVREAVVIVRQEHPLEHRLVAYIVAQPESVSMEDELRRWLQARLPGYMVPAFIVVLDTFPLTRNGKVDRKALPAPDVGQRAASYISPRTPTEELVAGVWAEILGVQQFGLNDKFFELGGHSLLATQVMSRLSRIFQVELPLRKIFEMPTVSELANAVDMIVTNGSSRPERSIIPAMRDSHLPLSFAQQRLWFLDQCNPNSSLYNISTALHLTGILNITVLEQSFNEVVRRHEVLRTTFVEVEGQPVQVIQPQLVLALPFVDLSDLPHDQQEAEVRRLMHEEARRPFDLTTGPLLRVCVFRLGVFEHVLVVVLHHIVSDAWSMNVLIREVITLYQTFREGAPSPLPPLPIQYADFAVWQRQWLQGEVLEAQLAYWRRQLSGAPVLELPTDRPRPAVQTYRGGSYRFTVPQALTEQLTALNRQQGVTLFMTLLAAFQVLLFRYTNQGDILVGTDVANRNRAETEDLIGFFVNLLVLRSDLSDNPTFNELLEQVREITLGSYTHQDLPFDKVVEALRPTRDRSRNPLVQVLFVLQNVPLSSLEVPGLQVSSLDLEGGFTKFDAALFLTETKDGLTGIWDYNEDLFDVATICRMATHFTSLLQSIVIEPDIPVSQLEMLTDAEKEAAVMAEGQREATTYKKFKSIKSKMDRSFSQLAPDK